MNFVIRCIISNYHESNKNGSVEMTPKCFLVHYHIGKLSPLKTLPVKNVADRNSCLNNNFEKKDAKFSDPYGLMVVKFWQ